MKRKKARKRKAVKYRKVTFKLTTAQMSSLEYFCRSRGTTPIKVIKQRLAPYLELGIEKRTTEQVHPQQLNIFDVPEYVESIG